MHKLERCEAGTERRPQANNSRISSNLASFFSLSPMLAPVVPENACVAKIQSTESTGERGTHLGDEEILPFLDLEDFFLDRVRSYELEHAYILVLSNPVHPVDSLHFWRRQVSS